MCIRDRLGTEDLLKVIVAVLEATRMTGDVIYGVRHPGQFDALHRHAPNIRALAMPAAPEPLEHYLDGCVTAVRLWEDEVTSERLARIHAAGREAWVTAGRRSEGEAPGFITAQRIAALSQSGVDAVLVNDPRLALAARA